MNGLIGAAALILVVVQYGSFNPDPLNDLTINFNIKDSPIAFADKEFEADNDEPHPVVIGGVTSNDEPLKDLEIFDGEWKAFPPDVPHVIHRTAAVTFENKIYFVGGINAPNTVVPFALFIERQENGQWDMVTDLNYKSDLNYRRNLHTANVLRTTEGPLLFVTGGEGGEGDTKDVAKSVEVYNLGPLEPNQKREWEIKPEEWNMNRPRIEHAAVQYNGAFYVIGGRGVHTESVNGMNSIEVFTDGKWKLLRHKKIMKQRRMGHGAEVVEDVIVVCGGKYRERSNTPMEYLRSCETFNGNQWDDNNIGDMNHIRSNFGFMFYGGKLWAFGGYNNGQVLSSVEFCVNDGQTPIPIWRLEDPKNFLKKPRAYFGVAKYISPQPQPSKKMRLKQANIVNSTFV